SCSRGHVWSQATVGSSDSSCPICGAIGYVVDDTPATRAGTTSSIRDPDATGPYTSAVPERPVPDIPGYAITAELGRGGMGVVYKAVQVRLKRPVALKMVLAAPHTGAQGASRFQAEAEAVARLQHPNIVQIHEVGEWHPPSGGPAVPYFSMEYLDGGSLHARLNGAPLPPDEAARLIETVARAVHAAHERGIVHRDLKPANILLAVDGTPKIADFGLAKSLDEDSGQTRTGAVLGTPSYMAPEQAAGRTQEIGPAADVWALGAI